MGKRWDSSGVSFRPETWATILRVAKPGAHLVAFGGSRTFHRIAVAIEDAGWEIRDTLCWLHGQGFPKSLDVSKAIDKAAGAERPRVSGGVGSSNTVSLGRFAPGEAISGEAISGEAIRWDGWGTALKPAFEPIILARKPFNQTVAANVLQHGTGALNVDACRIQGAGGVAREGEPSQERRYQGNGAVPFAMTPGPRYAGNRSRENYRTGEFPENAQPSPHGRWPANVVLDEEAARLVDEASGERKSGVAVGGLHRRSNKTANTYAKFKGRPVEGDVCFGDSGGASRFFYTSKASPRDRNVGNRHPTVKPSDLMRWLVRLVTPPGGTVLDPFCGSGTTGIACLCEGFNFVGIEQDEETARYARQRIKDEAPLLSQVTS